MNYARQPSWLLFFKYHDDIEKEWEDEVELEAREYGPIFDESYGCQSWVVAKTSDGSPDFNAALTTTNLIEFVNSQLFPYLQTFRETMDDPDMLDYQVGEVSIQSSTASAAVPRCATCWRSSTSRTSVVRRQAPAVRSA